MQVVEEYGDVPDSLAWTSTHPQHEVRIQNILSYEEKFGADEYVQLTTCIGYYAMLAMTVNGAELEPDPRHEALSI